ncbi:MAG: hypothetical protein ACP5HS_13570 [Anaerolineae bacterium]
MGGVIWLLGGLLVSACQTASLVLLVASLQPEAVRRVSSRVMRSYALRYALAGLVLAVAFREGVGAGLMAFAGLWVGRWGAVYLGTSGRINWSVFE